MAASQPTQRITKKERDQLLERMLAVGVPRRVIKEEMARRWGLRPRQAWRFAHGWSMDAMAAAYNARHDTTGCAPMSASRISAYERWPHKGERPTIQVLLNLACLFDTTLDHVIDVDDWAELSAGDRLAIQDLTRQDPASTVTGATSGFSVSLPQPSTTYRYWEQVDIAADQGEVVTMAAHEGSEHAEGAERRDIGEATMDQLRADVARLSRDYETAAPFAMFQEMRRVRQRLYTTLDRRLWPRDETNLYFLVAVVNGLMAQAADLLGNAQAAEELCRAGWAYAVAIDHRPLMALLRRNLSSFAYWDRPRQSRDLAASGLRYLSDGPMAAELHLQYGRAAARLGDGDAARASITAAMDARSRAHHDDLLEIGGEFRLTLASQYSMAGGTLVEIPGAEGETIAELEEAARLYAAGPEPGEQFSARCVEITQIDLATARIRGGQLDAALEALEPVLSLDPNQRSAALTPRLARVRAALAAPTYQGEPTAASLDERIEVFSEQTIATDLGDLAR